MRFAEVKAYSKEKAIEAAGFDIDADLFGNATLAWKKANAPTDPRKVKEFAEAYMKDKKKVGIIINVTPASEDTRERPYTVVNEPAEGRRKFLLTYNVVEAELKSKVTVSKDENGEDVKSYDVKVESTGKTAGKASKKSEANKLMKDLIRENRRSYVLRVTKDVAEGKEYASYGIYTPSKGAEEGKFFVFGRE